MSKIVKFFSTGEYFKDQLPFKYNESHKAEPGEGGKIYERNYMDQFNYEFKGALKTELSRDKYKTTYQFHNSDYKTKNYYTSKESNTSSLYNYSDENTKNIDHYLPLHLENFKMIKTKNFIKQAQNATSLNSGNILDKNTYKTSLNSSHEDGFKSDSRKLQTKNMFEIQKPLLRLDKPQLPFQIINRQKISDDAPNWCQTYNNFYKGEQKRTSRRKKNIITTDIFGNNLHDEKLKIDKLVLEPASSLALHEKRKMGVIEPIKKEEYKPPFRPKNYLKLEWRENIEKQRFEPKIPGKIGFTQQPFIKYLEKKKIIDKPMKIGKPDKPILINKEKAILLKIGHGNPENLGIK